MKKVTDHHHMMMDFSKALLKSATRPALFYLLTLSFTQMFFFSGLMYWLEAGINPHLQEFFDAFYFTVTTSTGVGFGDIAPVTKAGRILSMVIMLTGTALFVCYTALLASVLLEYEMDLKKKSQQSPSDF